MEMTPNRSILPSPMNVRTWLACLWIPLVATAAEPLFMEGEKIEVKKVSGQARVQDLQRYSQGTWSGTAHLWWTGAKPGESLELALPVVKEGVYRLGGGFTKAVD